MNPKWLIGVITLWLVLGLLGGIIERAYLGEDEGSKLAVLLAPMLASSFAEFVGDMFWSLITLEWWSAVFGMLVFDFAMFEGSLRIVQWFFFLPLAISVGISLMLTLVRGVSS